MKSSIIIIKLCFLLTINAYCQSEVNFIEIERLSAKKQSVLDYASNFKKDCIYIYASNYNLKDESHWVKLKSYTFQYAKEITSYHHYKRVYFLSDRPYDFSRYDCENRPVANWDILIAYAECEAKNSGKISCTFRYGNPKVTTDGKYTESFDF